MSFAEWFPEASAAWPRLKRSWQRYRRWKLVSKLVDLRPSGGTRTAGALSRLIKAMAEDEREEDEREEDSP